MKKTTPLFLALLVLGNSFAQTPNITNQKLSANLQQYLLDPVPSNHKSLITTEIGTTTYLNALVKVGNTINVSEFENLGVLVNTKAGNIWTVLIPSIAIKEFNLVDGVDFIQLDEPIMANLDNARKTTKVDSVHQGINLPMGYSGKNVVVGIIDAGFDYSHPTFYDTTGNVLRIKRVWEQKKVGTPPTGFAYGNEIKDTTSMLSKGTELADFTHGTHVAGIAAGSGVGSAGNTKFRGMAYESDLVFVGIRPEKEEWKTSGMSSIIDGMNYIYNYAKSVGKPAIVNLSWGCSIGPNDGSSLFSQACDNLTGPGKIFAIAAGNNGEDKLHIKKTFTPTDSTLATLVGFDAGLPAKFTWLDIWGDAGKSFCVKYTLFNGLTAGNTSGYLCLNNTTNKTFLIGSDNDTCFVTITRKSSDFNGKPHILMDIYCKSTNRLILNVKGTSGTVNLWLGYVESYNGYYGSFGASGVVGGTNGDANISLGEMACTKSAITVAAYASINSYKNLDGATVSYSTYVPTNQIVPFSSHGPTADFRIKPDITGPGLTVGSSVNSYDVSYVKGGSNYSSSVAKYTNPKNSRDYFYGEASGTSMATPAVSGIIALMLQANPNLSPQDVKDIFKQTAIKDAFTLPKPDSSRWGAGKVNAYGALKRTVKNLGISALNSDVVELILFPNPNNGNFKLIAKLNTKENVEVQITNLFGQVVFKETWLAFSGQNTKEFNPNMLTSGLYFVEVSSKTRSVKSKMIVL